jgi:hypothetical protein
MEKTEPVYTKGAKEAKLARTFLPMPSLCSTAVAFSGQKQASVFSVFLL